jgi:flagellar L-ring protein precursor FlgH
MNTASFFRLTCAALCAGLLSACATLEPAPLGHTPGFAPVYPSTVEQSRTATGAIFNPRQSNNLLGRSQEFRVGDVITVVLDEATQAGRQQSANVSRESSNDVVPTGLSTKLGGLNSVLGGLNLNSANIESGGKGQADQRATLKGAVSVTVVDVLANGNLVLRGEKQMALTEGAEVIQVSGIIRPADVSPNNTVQSRRLANAQFTYRGTGDMASASRAGWGTSTLLKFWPF